MKLCFLGKKFSTGPQHSEYVQVVCRNTNGTCLKLVSKTPTFRFFSDFQLLQHPAKLATYRPNLGKFWPKRAIFQISPKTKAAIFFDCRGQASCKKLGNSNAQFSKKMLKTPVFGRFEPKRPIREHFWPKRGHFRIFGEKAKTSLFYSFFSFFNTKIQKIPMRRFSGKRPRTDEQADVRR